MVSPIFGMWIDCIIFIELFQRIKGKIMNDNEIKTMLARLQQDLSDPSAPTAEWTHAEFIPLDERKKNVKILNTGYWLGNVAMVAGSAYSCLTIFAGATFMQLVLIGLVAFLILASTFSWYKYVLPAVLKREYRLTQYKMDFKKEKLEVPEEIKEEFQNDEYDLDSFGDAFVMMPKLEEDKRQKNLEKNIKKEWLEDFE